MNLKLKATVLMACLGAAAARDGGCLEEYPKLPERGACTCNSDPNAANFVACLGNDIQYFDDLSDLLNGYSICFVNGKKESISMTTCSTGEDCLPSLHCHEGFCVDDNRIREMDRLVTSCISPKLTDVDDKNGAKKAGCPSSYDDAHKLECHKYWISPKGMEWKRYLQYNPLGDGDTYAWGYDEYVCATSGHTLASSAREYCRNQDKSGSAIDSSGNVIDSTCPCAVENKISNLSNLAFQGYGNHMHLYIYDIMYPGYVKPTKRNDFTHVNIPRVAAEDSEFYLKVVNQHSEEILVYLNSPPARKNEHVSGPGFGPKFQGWTGRTKTTRGNIQQAQENVKDVDAWVSRITVAPNDNPSASSQPVMRVEANGDHTKNSGTKPTGPKLGGFYVPKGYHLRIRVGDQQADGWYGTNADCPDTACSSAGVNMWVTRADAYNKERNELSLFEPFFASPTKGVYDQIYFDLSTVEANNLNTEIIYGTIDNKIFVPLFESKDGLLSAEPDFNTESLTSLQ